MKDNVFHKKRLMLFIVAIASSASLSHDSTPDFLSTLNNDGLKRYLKSLPTAQESEIVGPPIIFLKQKIMREKKVYLGSTFDRILNLAQKAADHNKIPALSPITSDFFIEKMNVIDNPTGESLFEHIIRHNPSMTAAGKLNFTALLTSATTNVPLLQKRQNLIALPDKKQRSLR